MSTQSDPIPFVREKLAAPALEIPPVPGDDYAIAGQRKEQIAAARAAARPAAVLIGLIARPQGATILLTERSPLLHTHSGQVAFPGGKIDPGENALEAALREAEEEIGLARKHVEPFARLDPYLSGSGFCITPIVAEIRPPFDLKLNRDEVSATFEAPFDFVMDPKNHERLSREWKGAIRHFYAMPWKDHYIWGVTAGILRNMYERLYA